MRVGVVHGWLENFFTSHLQDPVPIPVSPVASPVPQAVQKKPKTLCFHHTHRGCLNGKLELLIFPWRSAQIHDNTSQGLTSSVFLAIFCNSLNKNISAPNSERSLSSTTNLINSFPLLQTFSVPSLVNFNPVSHFRSLYFPLEGVDAQRSGPREAQLSKWSPVGARLIHSITPWKASHLLFQTKCLQKQYYYSAKFLHSADGKLNFYRESQAGLGQLTVLCLFAAAANFCEHHRTQ